MAQQHYDGKKHKKNAARADLLEQLGKTLDMGVMKGNMNTFSVHQFIFKLCSCICEGALSDTVYKRSSKKVFQPF